MFARHDLVWLGGEGWRQALAGAPAAAVPALSAWQQAGWPAIVRRADADQAPGELAIGIALPPDPQDGRKVRVACRVAVDTIIRRERPLPLAQAVDVLPRWRPALAGLAREAEAAGLDIRIYGSAALQAMTGQAYLRESSDIDLLLQPANGAELEAGLALLRTHAAHLPLDGEIVFPGGRAVAWKEWAAALDGAAGTRVLVKEMTRVSLALPQALTAALEEEACLS
ncbi:malonate decarboxylase holo-[acyl-carrier-protein] synthase [Massilia sp. SYSU DXS3249]